MSLPVPYSDDVEQVSPDEDDVIRDLVETLLTISRKTFSDGHHGLRSVHAKSHALLTGRLEIFENAQPLAQGLFSKPDIYDVVMRFSTTPGDILPDTVSTPRGLAIKVLGVMSPAAPVGSVTQDFVMVNGPNFLTPNLKAFVSNLKLLAATTDRLEGAKIVVSGLLQNTEKVIEALGGKSSTLRALGGEPARHPLGETYFSQLPVRYGDYMAKISVVPVSEELTDLTGHRLDRHKDAFAIREAMLDHFASFGGVWELRVQLCMDLDTMPIENAAKPWPVEITPYIAVGRIRVEPQLAWSEARSAAIDDAMSFSPWHCLPEHRPLGSLMRARKAGYEASATYRRTQNGCPLKEPESLAGAKLLDEDADE